MISTIDKLILNFYNIISAYNNNYNNIFRKGNIKQLCKFMRKNDLKNALKCTNLIIENKEIIENI